MCIPSFTFIVIYIYFHFGMSRLLPFSSLLYLCKYARLFGKLLLLLITQPQNSLICSSQTVTPPPPPPGDVPTPITKGYYE